MLCKKCGNKIKYNKFKQYNKEVYCVKCYNEIKETKRKKRKLITKANNSNIEMTPNWFNKDNKIESHKDEKPFDPKEE